MAPRKWSLGLYVILLACGMAVADSRIVGGAAAIANEFPFIASLQRSGRHFCGGTLIDKSWVLTAAHCVKGLSASSLTLRLGITKQSDTGGEKFTAKKIISHPDYNAGKSTNDFALVQLSGVSKLEPAMLNSMDFLIADTEADSLRVTVAGWGTLSEGGNVSTNLMKVDVPLVSRPRCEAGYPGQIFDTQLCAGLEKGGKDSCQGDSGGPLVVRMAPMPSVLIGVVSWGDGCARPKKYGVYAKVSDAVDWIWTQTTTN